jgi:hypothetical protein
MSQDPTWSGWRWTERGIEHVLPLLHGKECVDTSIEVEDGEITIEIDADSCIAFVPVAVMAAVLRRFE